MTVHPFRRRLYVHSFPGACALQNYNLSLHWGYTKPISFYFDGVNESEQGFQHIPVEKLGSDVKFHSKSLKVQ